MKSRSSLWASSLGMGCKQISRDGSSLLGLRLGSNSPADSRGKFYPYGLETPVLARCWPETLSGPASEVDEAGQHWESKELWINTMEGRLAGKSRDKACQGHRNGLFQERTKLER